MTVNAIVADIGGTNTRVAMAEGATLRRDTIRRYRNAEHAGLADVLSAYVEAEGGPACGAACVAMAGPVRDGRGTLTNLDWTVDEAMLRDATGADYADVLNDLQAQGHALGRIGADDLHEVVAGEVARPEATQLVIGLGTGVNVAPVFHIPDGRLVAPAEAGHAHLPLVTEAEIRLGRYLADVGRDRFASVEEALSGRGIEQVYGWLGAEDGSGAKATSQAIIAALNEGGDPRAERAGEIFAALLGRVSANLALELLPFGGLYFSGGLSQALAPHLGRLGFARAFHDKGRFADLVRKIPVAVIADDYAALAGCAAHLDRIAPA